MAAVEQSSAWNTAVSFVTNTNWQGYSGESTMGDLVQMAGLAVQNFLSAAVGIAVAIALVRGFVRTTTDRLGNLWVDVTRTLTRVLVPICVVGALVLVLGGVVQNFSAGTDAHTLAGATAAHPRRAARADVPADAVTASGSALDPGISPAYAALQVQRVAAERGVSASEVSALVAEVTHGRDLGFIGAPWVDVLELNLALDREFGAAG
jgi:hypothetical protein